MEDKNPVWTIVFKESWFYAHHYYAVNQDMWDAFREEYDAFPSEFYEYDESEQKEILKKLGSISCDSLSLAAGLSPGKIIEIKKDGEVQANFAQQPLWKYPIGPREPCWTIDSGWDIKRMKDTVKFHIYNIAKWNRDSTTTKQVKRFFARNEAAIIVDVVAERSMKDYEYVISYEDLDTIEMSKFSFSFVDVPGDYPHFEKFFYDGFFMERLTKARSVVSYNPKVVSFEENS